MRRIHDGEKLAGLPVMQTEHTADRRLLVGKLGVHLDGLGGNVCRCPWEENGGRPGSGQSGTDALRAHATIE
jgi:hypothetical protein